MILLFDVRNASITIALVKVKDFSWSRASSVPYGTFSVNRCDRPDDCILFFSQLCQFFAIEKNMLTGAAITSVVPSVTASLTVALHTYFDINPFIVRPGIRSLLKIRIDNPAELGSDILVNSVAAATAGTLPAIVIDVGTATTITAISASAEIIGTVISPGLEIASLALREAAPQILFQSITSLDSASIMPPLLGKTTDASVHSGSLRGNAYLLNGFVTDISKEIFSKEQPNILLTGTFSSALLDYLDFPFRHDPMLTFRGLYQLYKINILKEK